MASRTASALRAKTDAAWANLNRQLQGMEPHLERSDAAGEWTTREVLSHLLSQPGWDPEPALKSFDARILPVVEIEPSKTHLTEDRKRMSLKQLLDDLDEQRRRVYGYVDTLSEADLESRKTRIPLFKQFMGTDEIPLARYIGAMFDYHWNDHAGQLAKIRRATGLPDAA